MQFSIGDITSCCYALIEALPLVRAINLPSKEAKITTLYERCKDREPDSSMVKKLEKIVISKAS